MHRPLLSLLAFTVMGFVGAGPVLAHGDEGALEVVSAVPAATGAMVTYTVELTYANDGDPVEGAVVTATARRAGAGARPPVTLPSIGDGWYAADVTFPGPGQWTVTFTAAEPAASVDAGFEVSEAPTTTVTPTSSLPPTTAAPVPVDDDALATDDDGPPAGLIVGAGFAGAALVATLIVLALRRRSPDAAT